MLDDKKREIIQSLAENSLCVTLVAKKLYIHRNTALYHLNQIKKKTGLDPLNFYDLIKLLELVKDGDS